MRCIISSVTSLASPKGAFGKRSARLQERRRSQASQCPEHGHTDVAARSGEAENENLFLRKQIGELRLQKALATSATPKGDPKAPLPPGTRTHVVQSGETLAAISQKYYKTRNRSQDILDANQNQLGKKSRIIPGQTLIIPN